MQCLEYTVWSGRHFYAFMRAHRKGFLKHSSTEQLMMVFSLPSSSSSIVYLQSLCASSAIIIGLEWINVSHSFKSCRYWIIYLTMVNTITFWWTFSITWTEPVWKLVTWSANNGGHSCGATQPPPKWGNDWNSPCGLGSRPPEGSNCQKKSHPLSVIIPVCW